MRKFMIGLRSFYIKWIKNERSKPLFGLSKAKKDDEYNYNILNPYVYVNAHIKRKGKL